MHNVELSFYDDDCQEEEKCDSSNSFSSSDECDCVTIPTVEVLSEKEDVWDDHNSGFSCSITNKSTITNVSSYPDNDPSQGKEISSEVLLSVDQISDLLAYDFERYANNLRMLVF